VIADWPSLTGNVNCLKEVDVSNWPTDDKMSLREIRERKGNSFEGRDVEVCWSALGKKRERVQVKDYQKGVSV
jgi:hypothetical protein